ncbi:MAG: nicotinate (nicotinamide) nucleotide adenylyltransferase [Clostridia bacterium]
MKIAIFGGAFDPLHSEHIKVVTACKEELKAEKVIVLPSFCPPHKSNIIASYEDRLNILHIALDCFNYVEISELEKESDYNPSYLTLQKIKNQYPDDELFFITGGDGIEYFDRWNKPEEIVKLVTLVVVKRDGYNQFAKAIDLVENKFNINIISLNTKGEDVSSTQVRASIILGLDTPNEEIEVLDYIKEQGVYSKYDECINKLKTQLSIRTYNHCVRTTMYGLKLAAKQKMSFEKVFLACLFHDCAKNTKVVMDGVPNQVVHQFVGSEIASKEYNINDEEILSAIRYHTTGKANMSQLEKLVFMADMLEDGRDYEGVEELRKAVDDDFELGFVACITATLENLIVKKTKIFLLTNQCYEYYTNKDI